VNQAYFLPWRFYTILCVILIAAAGLVGRIFYLTILDQHFLRQQGNVRVLRLVDIPAYRGMIIDRNNFPLAVSTPVYSVWINPLELTITKKEISSVSQLLDMKSKELNAIIKRNEEGSREFVYLKRGLSPEVANKIKGLNVTGLYTQQEYRRFYPEGETTAQIIGFTNIDDQGQEGLELAYNVDLQGEQGKQWIVKDRMGRVISKMQTMKEQRPGKDLILSIDRRIQYLAYRELLAGVTENKALSGTAIVLDAKSGEILAMVNYPSFNPNNRVGQNKNAYRNRAITDTFEPGSTIKAFSVASALDSGKFKPDTVIDTYPGWIRVGHNIVKDEHNNEKLTVTKVLQISSNVGVTKMILSLPPDHLWDVLHRVGFGETTGVAFPGEQEGSLVKHHPWGAFTLATLGFGYGISVTPLQLARAYSVLANHGEKLPVSLLRVDKAPKGEVVMNPKTAQAMLNLLESVVTKGGTGELANVPGYRVAGKTGTALKAGDHGYQKHHYIASFVGIAPVSDPRLVVAVIIDDPQGKHYHGGSVSGPVFEKIMEGTLRLLAVAPDAVQEAA
jgi:cell division protein FtsI (penicillin-binding protein 3)